MIDKNLKDLLDAGLGLFKLGEGKIQEIVSDLEKNFNQLKEKGAEDHSEAAVRLRELLTRTMKDVRNVTDQAEKNLNSFLNEAKNNTSITMQNFKDFAGEKNINDFNAKMNEIANHILKRPADPSDSPDDPKQNPPDQEQNSEEEPIKD
ncbi:MAG: hypothetical protein OEZ34_10230 [Spirochaetia bacterium]|nr:hypothetical protein [Spirochaetia bacterium]